MAGEAVRPQEDQAGGHDSPLTAGREHSELRAIQDNYIEVPLTNQSRKVSSIVGVQVNWGKKLSLSIKFQAYLVLQNAGLHFPFVLI